MNEMKLGKKINLVLIVVVAVVLTVAFWVVINIESRNLRQQVTSDAETVTSILHADMERMFKQIHKQEVYLQDAVDEISKNQNVKYVDVNDVENKYIATTDHSLIGQKINDTD